jgi:hypothetical protein
MILVRCRPHARPHAGECSSGTVCGRGSDGTWVGSGIELLRPSANGSF